jgi:hypothetical protein
MYILYFSNSQWVRFAYAAVKFVANRKSKFLVTPTSNSLSSRAQRGMCSSPQNAESSLRSE